MLQIAPPTTTDERDGAADLCAVHSDVILTHILTHLDGPTLASASCASAHLRALATDQSLWTDICRATWPSTEDPRMQTLINSFPNGPRSFFSDAFPAVVYSAPPPETPDLPPATSELISAVDIHFKNRLIFSKVQSTETVSGWFRCSPFRIDFLEPKDVVPTPITNGGDMCGELAEGLTLTWVVVDPAGRRAANFSSRTPVSVQRHWLSGGVQVRFATVLAGNGESSEMVQCGILVTMGGCEGGEVVQVREVSFQVEDMDGISLNGKESLGILQRAIESGERRKGDREESRVRYEEYVKMKRERKERELKKAVRLDALCTALGVSVFAAFSMLLFYC